MWPESYFGSVLPSGSVTEYNINMVYYKTSLKKDTVILYLNLDCINHRNVIKNLLSTILKVYNNDLPITVEKEMYTNLFYS